MISTKKYLRISSLPDERSRWRCEMLGGRWEDPYNIWEYRKNLDSNLGKASRQEKQICQYILHPEGMLPPT